MASENISIQRVLCCLEKDLAPGIFISNALRGKPTINDLIGKLVDVVTGLLELSSVNKPIEFVESKSLCHALLCSVESIHERMLVDRLQRDQATD